MTIAVCLKPSPGRELEARPSTVSAQQRRSPHTNKGPIRECHSFQPCGNVEEFAANDYRSKDAPRTTSSINSLDRTHHSSNGGEHCLQLQQLDDESLWETETLSSLGTLFSYGASVISKFESGDGSYSKSLYPPLQEILLMESKICVSDGVECSSNSTPTGKPTALAHRQPRKSFSLREEPESAPPSISNVRSKSPTRDWNRSLHGSSQTMPHEHAPHARAVIEISPGTDAYLIGAQETMEALSSDRIMSCSCIVCNTWLIFKDEASAVLCPVCHSMSPVEAFFNDEFLVVGLGVLLE